MSLSQIKLSDSSGKSYTPTLIRVLNHFMHWQILLVFIPLYCYIFLNYLNQVRNFNNKKASYTLSLTFASRLNFRGLCCYHIFMILSPAVKIKKHFTASLFVYPEFFRFLHYFLFWLENTLFSEFIIFM